MLKNRALAIELCKQQVPQLVADACQLEGIHVTVAVIQALQGQLAIGFQNREGHDIALNQLNAWSTLLSDLTNHSFELTKVYSNKIHGIAAKHDALTWGAFRTGSVTIAGTHYLPPPAEVLEAKFAQMISGFSTLEDDYEKAFYLFLHYAKNQFYYDNNKRQGRFMMNAYLLDQGLPAISIPKNRETQFNDAMLRFYASSDDDITEMHAFMVSCIDPVIAAQFDLPIIK